MVLQKLESSRNLDFDELSVASSYEDNHNENNNNNQQHQLSSLNIDDRESLPSEHSDDYDTNNTNFGSNSPLHMNNDHPTAEQSTPPSPIKQTNLPLLSACYMAALTTGATTYAFSFYSNALKSSLHLSQNQLDTLSSAIFCAGILSWMPGMVVDSFGARFAIIVGGIGNSFHLTCYWMIVTERWKISNMNVLMFLLSVLGVLIFVGCALVTGSVFKVIVESCGKGTKGKAVGCAKGYVGVGSGVYVCLFSALFGSSGSGGAAGGPAAALMTTMMMPLPSIMSSSSSWSTFIASDVPQNPELNSLNFLIMAAVLSFLAAVLPALCLLPKQTSRASPFKNRRDGTRSVHFRVIYAGLILLGVWVIGTSLVEIEEEKIDSRHGGDDGSSVTPDSSITNKTTTIDWVEDFSSSANGGELSSFATTTLLNFARRHLSSQSSSAERHWGAAFLLLMLWWSPALSLLVIPPRKEEGADEGMISERNTQDFSYDNDDGSDDNNEDDEELEETFLQDDDIPVERSRRYRKSPERDDNIEPERNYTMLEMLRTSSAWLMVWTCVILVGGGTVMTNNIGQMTEALGFDSDLTPASLALFSAAQAASRVITGAVSEAALSWKLPWFCGYLSSGGKGLARPAFLVVASVVSAAAHFSLAIATTEEGFALGVTLSGIAFGMVWPLMVLITGEVFGTLHVGANYMFFDGFSSAAGTLLLSKFVAQTVYDDHIDESHGDSVDEGSNRCFGTECFQLSHFIVSALSLTCIISSVGLIWTTRDVYRRS